MLGILQKYIISLTESILISVNYNLFSCYIYLPIFHHIVNKFFGKSLILEQSLAAYSAKYSALVVYKILILELFQF